MKFTKVFLNNLLAYGVIEDKNNKAKLLEDIFLYEEEDIKFYNMFFTFNNRYYSIKYVIKEKEPLFNINYNKHKDELIVGKEVKKKNILLTHCQLVDLLNDNYLQIGDKTIERFENIEINKDSTIISFNYGEDIFGVEVLSYMNFNNIIDIESLPNDKYENINDQIAFIRDNPSLILIKCISLPHMLDTLLK